MPPPLPRSPSGSSSGKTRSSSYNFSSHSNGKDPVQIAKLVKLPESERARALNRMIADMRKTKRRQRAKEVALRRATRRKARNLQQGNREIKREKHKFYHDLAKKVLGKNFLRPGQISLVERHLGERMSVSGSAQEETLYEELRRSERAALAHHSPSGSSSSNSNHSAYELSSSGSGPKKPPPKGKYKPMEEM